MMTMSPGRSVGARHFCQIFDEDCAVHRAINDERSGETIKPKPGHKCYRFPVAPWNAADDPPPPLGSAVKPRHLGRCPGLINEDQLGWIKPGLFPLPALAGVRHVRPLLLGRAHAFF